LIAIFSLSLALSLIKYAEDKEWSPTGHDMDYAPIFVWIEKDPDSDWKFIRAIWDTYHYRSDCWPRPVPRRKLHLEEEDLDSLENERMEESETRLKDGKRIRLSIDNPWRDFSPYTSGFDISLNTLIRISVIAVIPSIISVFAENTLLWAWSYVAIIVLMLVLFRVTFDLTEEGILKEWQEVKGNAITEKEFLKKHHLSQSKLEVLWNLSFEEARLKIISKFQDPFNLRPDFFNSFRDDARFLLYEILKLKEKISNLDK
jgi:hypothetical protein